MARKEANIVVRLKDRASSGFKRLGQSVGAVLKPIAIVTSALGGLVSLAGGAFLVSAIRNTGSFGEQLSILQGLTRGSAEEMAALEEAARNAGATTRFSALEAGQGLEELSRGGQNAREAIDTLNPVLQLAAGNNQSVAESAQQVITTLNQFSLATDQAGRVSDVFTRAAQSSAQTTQQLARALQQAGPVAAQAKLSIEETAAVIGLLADSGFRGERGGTALRNALSQLSDPASKFRKELAALGINSTNFVEVLGELEKQGDGANKAIRALGLESAPAITALVQSGSADLQQLIGNLNDAGGAASDAARAMEDNLPGAFRNLKSAFSELQIALTQPLTEEIKEGVFDLADAVRNFAGSDTLVSLRDVLVETFQAGRTAVQEFVSGIDLVEVGKRIRDFVAGARERIAEFKQQAFNLQAAFTQIVGGVNVLVGSLRAGFNALGTGVATVMQLVLRQAENYLSLLDKMSLGLNPLVNRAQQAVEDIKRSVDESAADFGQGLRDGIDQVSEGLDQMSTRAKQAAGDIDQTADSASQSGEKAREGFDGWTEATLRATEGQKDLGEETERTGSIVGKINGVWTRLKGSLDSTTDSVADLEREAAEAATPFDKLQDSIRGAASVGELDQFVRQMGTLRDQGEITDEEFQKLTGTVLEKARALRDAAAAGDENAGSLKRGADAAKENAEAQKSAGDEAEESSGRMVRLGGSIKLAAAAQQAFNDELSKWEGGGTAAYIQHFKRSLEGALVVQREVERAQARLNTLQGQGVSVTDNFAEANRNLRYELMELRGETEKLAEAQEEERMAALKAQLALAQAQGDDERVERIRENIRLTRELEREREREAQNEKRREQDRDPQADKEAAEAMERASRGGVIRQEIRVVIESGIGRDGRAELSQADLDRLTDRIMQRIDIDRART